jgi:hypothetical protein
MNNATFKVGDLVRPTHSPQRVGIVTRYYGRDLFDVLFGCGNTYTCFHKDLVAL